jgi:hypothetical protein
VIGLRREHSAIADLGLGQASGLMVLDRRREQRARRWRGRLAFGGATLLAVHR